MKWIILLLGIAANSSASLLVKIAVMPPRKFPSLSDPMSAFTNWPFWLGLGLYGAAFLLYAAALARIPLNVAHPILTCGAVASVAFLSMIIFKEPFHWITVTGILLVIAGVFLISSRVA
ncbi:EamA family transporter [Verminephrobacter aporrectodeae]|uniref:Multidrug transporter n=1 Tax=Verminephrobacter aporrectodeae subsp. tuberculatae TaxID=1110392 RepID=A0ABT3KTK2_9BURK|nr:EamA family transporter [Verminephrobacter aporrectodeae]MCW5222551.1 multidrug transporter [Verminephrobacter aporrectodeae subsp. tuberculatae]MCW5257239.1 multidrug transporter [Verminephrobacter aporrectodeae subsp. tuberculatae]MCW5288016.1 multidrug transporter [Verminephrobacter aporrectodeae subsp. tuberculatae]MCW5321580.1 multidrug transporter [Verminephrobacter aporrectodeae subsp. tuberculatae]MCW8174979.1 multidrug transporter [Verminephrobacter aporrectodeae subsp. tuberculata